MNRLVLGLSATASILVTGLAFGQTAQDQTAADTTITTTTTTRTDRSANVNVRLASYDTSNVAFRKLDKNGDGRISRSEAAADPRVAAAFSAADHDNDGFLTEEEFKSLSSTSPRADVDASSPNGDSVSDPGGDRPATAPTDTDPPRTVTPNARQRE